MQPNFRVCNIYTTHLLERLPPVTAQPKTMQLPGHLILTLAHLWCCTMDSIRICCLHTLMHAIFLHTPAALKISVPKWCGKWVVGMDEYKDGVVGAKSKNLAGLRGKLPDAIKLPSSITLPFGCFEQASLQGGRCVWEGYAAWVAATARNCAHALSLRTHAAVICKASRDIQPAFCET